VAPLALGFSRNSRGRAGRAGSHYHIGGCGSPPPEKPKEKGGAKGDDLQQGIDILVNASDLSGYREGWIGLTTST